MVRRDLDSNGGSLDMLLDTMCNTFGGVCFLALMVCVMLAMLPKVSRESDQLQEVEAAERMLFDKEKVRLFRQRDELNAAVAIKEGILAANSNKLTVVRINVSGLASNKLEIARLKRYRLELEDQLAKLTTDSEYSQREAARLARLLQELEEKLGTPVDVKKRVVRTPVEREVPNTYPVDIILWRGHFYEVRNETQVFRHEFLGADGKRRWNYTPKDGCGIRVDASFCVTSDQYKSVVRQVTDGRYLRIFTDAESFGPLCQIRDDLVCRRKMYNWHILREKTLHLIEGVDSSVQ